MGRRKKRSREYPILKLIEQKEREAKELLNFYIDLKRRVEEIREKDDIQKVLALCVPGSFIEDLVLLTYKHTDIPPSIAFFSGMVLLGAKLTSMDVHTTLGKQKVYPNLWVLTLAPSGSGKTYAVKHIVGQAIDEIEEFPGTSTAAAAVKMLAEYPHKRRAVVLRDEVAQLFKMLRKDTYSDLKDFFLRAYDGGPIERQTKKDGLVKAEDVYLSFYGTTVLATFAQSLRAEDLLDGFFQRFLLHIAEEVDRIVPLYIVPSDKLEVAREKFHALIELTSDRDKHLPLTGEAVKLYEQWYTEFFNKEHESYYRRYMFASIRYATIYAALMGSDRVDIAHMGYALRAIDWHLVSLYEIMQSLAFDDYDLLVRRVEEYLKKHPDCTRREVVQGVWGIRTVKQLNAILELLALKGNRKAEELLSSTTRK